MYAFSILASGSDGGGGSNVSSLLILLLIPFAMYFFLIRPQRKRMKDQASLQSSIGIGDEVITSSGVYGFITGEEGDVFWLEVDDDVQIRIARAAIQGKVPAETDETSDDKASSESGDDSGDDVSVDDEADESAAIDDGEKASATAADDESDEA